MQDFYKVFHLTFIHRFGMALRVRLLVVTGFIAVCVQANRVPREQLKVPRTESRKEAGNASAALALLGVHQAAVLAGKSGNGDAPTSVPVLYPPVTPTSAIVGPVLGHGPASLDPNQIHQTDSANEKNLAKEETEEEKMRASRFLPMKDGGRARFNMDGSYVMYQDIPVEVRNELRLAEEQAAREKDNSFMGTLRQALADIGGGTGATVGGTGSSAIDRDLIRRMRYQDKVVMVLLLLAYMFSLAFSASVVYSQAFNNSAVSYYADPRFHTMTVDGHDVEDFLVSFNQAPRDVQLQVIGMMPLSPFPGQENMVDWIGSQHRIAFAFALDLSPWITPDGSAHGYINEQGENELGISSSVGVKESDLAVLKEFLARNRNDLAMVEIVKEVTWPEWEELATNIKQRIRQAGFTGVIDVRRADKEVVTIYKNRPWANFLHSRTTKVLIMLSIVGWLIYQPYIWIRNRSIQVSTRFRIDVPIETYWSLISDKIGPHGFDPAGAQ